MNHSSVSAEEFFFSNIAGQSLAQFKKRIYYIYIERGKQDEELKVVSTTRDFTDQIKE